MRYAMMDTLRDTFSVSELCEALDVCRSGYLARCTRPGPTRPGQRATPQANESHPPTVIPAATAAHA